MYDVVTVPIVCAYMMQCRAVLCVWQILAALRKLCGRRLFRALMKRSVYGQFLAGETHAEILGNVQRLARSGVLPFIGFTSTETHGDTL